MIVSQAERSRMSDIQSTFLNSDGTSAVNVIFTDINRTLKVLLSILNSDGSKAHNTSLYTQQFIEHSSLWLCFVFYECILRVYDVNNCIVNRQLRWALLSVSCLTQAPWLTLDSTLGWRLHSPWWSSSGSARGSWFHSSSWPLCPLLPELSTNLAKEVSQCLAY